MSTDESDLIRRAIQGDREAFGDLVTAYQTVAFRVAFRMLGNQEDAEDATQEAFLRAFHAMDRFDPARAFGPWIKKITANLCLNLLERKTVLSWDPDWLPSAQDPEPTPEEQSELRDRNARIRAALLQLPPRYRAAIELRHFQGLTYSEMADALDCPLTQVKSDLYRARQILIDRTSAILHL